MKIVSQLSSRLRVAWLVAVAALLLLLIGGVLFRGSSNSWSGGDGNADAVATHVTQMRAELARIHSGKVDRETLRRILHLTTPGAIDGVAPVNAGDEDGYSSQIVRYLAGQDTGGNIAMTNASFVTAADTNASEAAAQPMPAEAESDDRFYVGQKTCESCHQQEASNWAHTIHAAVFDINPRNSTEAEGCEACHGPGSAHIKNPSDLTTIISFSHKSQTPVAQQNAQCLSCHQGGQRIFWHGSIHENNSIACSDCHNPMTNFSAHGLTARDSINQTCFSCHKVQRAEFAQRSHMPLLEGKISCVDCHNPHGSTTAPLLKADSVNEVCYGCHADKRGPFLFEHAPVRENCLNCHNPHGSNFEALLTTPRPMLCQECHEQDGHPAQLLTMGNLAHGPMPDPRLISTSCQTCHVNIHGSNDPSGSRFER